jgi:hypothetical protein
MSPIIGEENLKEQIVQFGKNRFNLFQDYDPQKWLKRNGHQEGQIEWKVEDIAQNVFKF